MIEYTKDKIGVDIIDYWIGKFDSVNIFRYLLNYMTIDQFVLHILKNLYSVKRFMRIWTYILETGYRLPPEIIEGMHTRVFEVVDFLPDEDILDLDYKVIELILARVETDEEKDKFIRTVDRGWSLSNVPVDLEMSRDMDFLTRLLERGLSLTEFYVGRVLEYNPDPYLLDLFIEFGFNPDEISEFFIRHLDRIDSVMSDYIRSKQSYIRRFKAKFM